MDVTKSMQEINNVVVNTLRTISTTNLTQAKSQLAMDSDIVGLIADAHPEHISKLLNCDAPIATLADANNVSVWAKRFEQAKIEARV